MSSSNSFLDIASKSSWIIWSLLFLMVGGGVITNSILSIRLARRHILPISLHLTIADISVLLFLAPYELLILADGSGIWNFPDSYCKVFLGMETFLGTAIVYLIVLLNFSILAKEEMSFKLELMIIWLISASLSIPQFFYANVVPLTPEYRVCYVPKYATLLVAIFRACVPTALLCITFILILFHYKKLTRQKIPSEVQYSVIMSALYLLVSEHRTIFLLMFRLHIPKYWLDTYRIPPFAEAYDSQSLTLLLSGLHYSFSTVRPLICWFLCSRVRLKEEKPLGDNMGPGSSNTYYSYPI